MLLFNSPLSWDRVFKGCDETPVPYFFEFVQALWVTLCYVCGVAGKLLLNCILENLSRFSLARMVPKQRLVFLSHSGKSSL